MQVDQLIWTSKTMDKLTKKHHLTPEEVEEVFDRKVLIRRSGRVYHFYGQDRTDRYLLVVLIPLGKSRWQVVTARDMTQTERRLYLRTQRR